MCPDRQLVSMYCDGELPSPWKEKLETHLESCEECRGILAGYRGVDEFLQDFPVETVREAGERVWKRLAISDFRENTVIRRKRVWNRTVTLPLPAAAAAVLVVIGFLAFMVMGNLNRPLPVQDSIAAASTSIGFDEQGMLDIQDMNDVLQYLSGQDKIEFLVIQIPESWNFSRSGEPALINAADYSRRSSSR